MTLTAYERTNTIKVEVDLKSNDVLTDPSGNMAFIDVYKSDGTKLVDTASGQRTGTGEYEYYFTTAATDPLGIYKVVWWGHSYVDGTFNYKRFSQADQIQIVDLDP